MNKTEAIKEFEDKIKDFQCCDIIQVEYISHKQGVFQAETIDDFLAVLKKMKEERILIFHSVQKKEEYAVIFKGFLITFNVPFEEEPKNSESSLPNDWNYPNLS